MFFLFTESYSVGFGFCKTSIAINQSLVKFQNTDNTGKDSRVVKNKKTVSFLPLYFLYAIAQNSNMQMIYEAILSNSLTTFQNFGKSISEDLNEPSSIRL